MSEPSSSSATAWPRCELFEELIKRALGRYAIAVVGEEPRLAYNRVLLSSVLAQEMSLRRDRAQVRGLVADRGVTLHYGKNAARSNRHPPRARSPMARAALRRLVLCHRLAALQLQGARQGLPGVIAYRDIADVAKIERGGQGGRPW